MPLVAQLVGDALDNSHWVAERTATRLGALAVSFRGDDATRERIEATLADRAVTGVVFCGHGRDEALVRRGENLLDLQNLSAIGDRWLHAFACNSGNRLALSAEGEGVGAYLGYHRPVVVEWSADRLPPAVAEILEDVVTTASLRLHDGERSRRAIVNAVEAAYDRWIQWCEEHGDDGIALNEFLGLHALRRLFDCVELHGTQVRD